MAEVKGLISVQVVWYSFFPGGVAIYTHFYAKRFLQDVSTCIFCKAIGPRVYWLVL